MSLETLARDVLAADAGVLAIVRANSVTRIYPLILPQSPTLPALTYQGISKTTDYSFDEAGLVRTRLQVDAWANTYLAAKALARAVRDAFHTYAGADAGIHDFQAVNETDLFEDIEGATGTTRLYRVRSDYFAWARDQAA